MGRETKLKNLTLRWNLVAEYAPIVLPVALVAFSIVAVGLLLLGQFQTFLVWPLGLLAAAAAVVPVLRYGKVERPGSQREQRIADWAVLIGLALWAGFNVLYTSEHVLTNRDPGTYAVSGARLVTHESLKIPTSQVFGDTHKVNGLTNYSAGFAVDKKDTSQAYAQGMHLLPALLGASGRLVGQSFMLHIPPLFGAIGLLAVYGFARLLVRPRWALLATLTLAVSLPMIYFSRDTYTEPLSLAFTFGALALLWIAQKTKQPLMWLLAGLTVGAGAMTRIDAYLTTAGIVAFLAVLVTVTPKAERKQMLRNVALLLSGTIAVSLLGWLDLMQLSPLYYRNTLPQIRQEFLVIGGAAVMGIGGFLLAWQTTWLQRLNKATWSWRGPAIAIIIIVVAIVLASRPLWHIDYQKVQNTLVAALQREAGSPVAPRTYAEQTGYWVAWYIGPLFAILGAIGLALAAARAMVRRDLLLVAGICVVGITTIVYLIKPSITPDHIWASRRLLPVILPGLLVFGVMVLEWLNLKFFNRHKHEWLAIGAVSLVLLAVPVFISRPYVRMREMTQLPALNSVCKAVPKNAAILWIGTARSELLQSTQAFCNIPSSGYHFDDFATADFALAAQNAKKAGKQPLIGVYGYQAGIFEGRGLPNMQRIGESTYPVLVQTVDRPPHRIRTQTDQILIGKLETDGSIVPLPSQ